LASINSVSPHAAPVVQVAFYGSLILPRSIRPQPRPNGIVDKASAPLQGAIGKPFGGQEGAAQKPKPYASGGVCKDSATEGTMIAAIKGRQNGCGIDAYVRVTAVYEINLLMPATVYCDAARALRKWVAIKEKPAVGKTKLVGLDIAAHYVCRV
jgi:hypothetical protein